MVQVRDGMDDFMISVTIKVRDVRDQCWILIPVGG